jgi:hypothetical protein
MNLDKISVIKQNNLALFENLVDVKKHIEYVPTGLQEDIILAVGCGQYQIIVAIDANKVGKTTAEMNISRQIIWPEENEYFRFWEGENIFKKWPFKTKRFRLTGTPTNLADNGAIQQALKQWWPKGRYTMDKAGKHFYSSFKTDSGWEGDALTYEQSPAEYEGPMLDLVLSDEPPKPALIGAINSRMAEGGIWLIGMTPINCGVFLDTLDDLIDKGKRIHIVTGSAYENDKETGKQNHNGTKRGLWTAEQIADYVAGIPPDEQDARVKGIASHKSGKIFPTYDEAIHWIGFDRNFLSQCACYMSIDPHDSYYPFITWHAVTPNDCDVVYNEWPKFEDFGMYYDEARNSVKFTKTPEELAQIILANDLRLAGAEILARAIDPRFHSKNLNYIVKLQELGVTGWQIPDCEQIAIQRTNLQSHLNYDKRIQIVGVNTPRQYVAKECRNVNRALSRHYWVDGKDEEAEDYKDPIDCIRYRYNLTDGKILWVAPKKLQVFQEKPKGLAELMMKNRPAQGYNAIRT